MDTTAPFRIEECLSFAWNAWKRDVGTYLVATIVLLVANALLHLVVGLLHLPFFFVTSFIMDALISGLFSGAFMAVVQRGARGETPNLEDALRPFRERQGDYLIVGLAMSSGVILLGIGVIVTSVLFMFAPLAVVQGAGYEAALRSSKDLVLARLADAAVLAIALALLNVVGAIACGVGLLVTLPVSALALARAHAMLTGAVTPVTTPSLPGGPTV